MKQFYALNIQNDYVYVLFVQKNGKQFSIINQQIIDLSELSEFLKNKKSYYLSIEQDEDVVEKITIESLINNESVIRSLILMQLHEVDINKKLIFNYVPLPKNINDETTTYLIDGVFEDNYLSVLELIKNLNELKSASTNKFSLLGISCECIKDETFFSVHTQANKITIIAIHKQAIIFSREHRITADNAELRELNLVEGITQSIAYAQQQFREINFSIIALSGSIVIDEIMVEHICMSSELGVTVLYPNTFIQGFEYEEAQEHIFAIGSWFIPKKYQFLPTSVLAHKQYNIISKVLLTASIIFVLISFFYTYEKYSSYADSLQNYEIIKDKLNKTANKTHTYSIEELHSSLKYIQIVEQYLKYHPLDLILTLKPLIELLKPQELQWQYLDKSLELNVKFKHSFRSLKDLYRFEKLFFNKFEDINSTFSSTYKNNTDYSKMNFDTTLTIESSKKERNKTEILRKRRR
ncbi:hypothetical protein [Sulfurimonas sp.]|jgi:hypothetical protein|uniref:hypothetical protein n=1 Tax=Sulfurimonas sp. TaxID=2022749 RepID=UPI0025F058C2|nr:hypothetical protein [Sulfurimonas sp.]MBT5934274.1 hypothetical protein [Sulfurimonas sp.]